MKFVILVFIIVFNGLLLFGSSNSRVLSSGDIKYLSNEIIIKFHNPIANSSFTPNLVSDKIKRIFESYNINALTPLFPQTSRNSKLSAIYSIKYKDNINPVILSSKISNNPEIEWAEPRFIYEADYTPNDSSLSQQWNLQKIKATQSFDFSKGDTNVVVGIVDTGIDWLHPDLSANVWRNYNEIPNNNIDDDNNGYIDDFVGWDFGGLFGTPDNDPKEDKPEHGTHVAGITSAVTDNGIGISSIGFKAKLMAIKSCRNDYRSSTGKAYIIYGYEGIVYAVNNGADIINCSWGGTGYSKLGQEVINFAAENGTLVVAASGNSNSNEEHFPSSYKNAFSVGSTDEGDLKSSFSNYGYSLDVSAPGSSIYSTWQGGGYSYASGTSMASPLVAGLIALVKARYPNLTSVQCGEIVRSSSDNINSINPSYNDLLGKGRINAFTAVSKSGIKSVRNVKIEFNDEAGNNNGIIEPNETIIVKCEFINYLTATQNLKIYLQSESPNINITNTQFIAGALNPMQIINNNSVPFVFTVASNIPQNSTILLKLFYSDGDYTDYEWVPIIANQTYGNQNGNNISLTITSKGTLAFNDYPNNLQGIGFKYNDQTNMLFEGALLIGNSATHLSDAARGTNANLQNNEYKIIKPFSLKIPGGYADIEGSAKFNDSYAANPLGVEIQLHSYSFSDEQNADYLVLRYRIKNTSTLNISNFYAGLFLDWDIVDGSGMDDYTQYNENGKYGYAYHIGGNPNTYTGCALISDNKYGYWGILNNGGDGGFSIFDGFTKEEKWTSISSGIGKPQAGGGDISFVTSAGPYSINSGDSIDIAFAVGAADSLIALSKVFENARNKYPSIPTKVNLIENSMIKDYSLSQNYPNPFNPETTINICVPVTSRINLTLFDLLGNRISELLDEEKTPGNYSLNISSEKLNLASGVYFVLMQTEHFNQTIKMILLK